ncbi:hypothetical protein FBU59_001945 [Linderina macrospora]|uniref:Uncharacterized protein n=1 Tax=Linderina macrospora TaxID=4868 RepID=A0ACC1JCD5_9FUNG|nr:hypothetical protein FBU59_001945 [Linderina macrospora]
MTKVCEFFLRGKCHFGDKCRNEHPRGNQSGFGQSSAQSIMNQGQNNMRNAFAGINSGAFGGNTQSKGFGGSVGGGAFGQTGGGSAFGQTGSGSAFGQTGGGSSAFGGTGGGGGAFGQNSGDAIPAQPAEEKTVFSSTAGTTDEKLSKLSDNLLKKMAADRPIWRISSFGPISNEPNMLAGMDMSPEEARIEYMLARNSGTLAQYDQKYAHMENAVAQGLQNIIADPSSAVSQWIKNSSMAVSQEALAKRNVPKVAPAPAPAPAASAFGQASSASAFGQTSSSGSAFGQSSSSAFGQTSSSSSAFGQGSGSSSAFGQNTKPVGGFGQQSAFGQGGATGGFGMPRTANVPSFGSTPEDIKRLTGPTRELTAEETTSFKTADFSFGMIPEVPPPIELRDG